VNLHGRHKETHNTLVLLNKLSQHISILPVFFIFIVLDFPYQIELRHLSILKSILPTLLDATIFTNILWVTTRLDLARVTLCFLAIPYLIFFPGWLNTPAAIVLLAIFIYCITNTLQRTISTKNTSITIRDLVAFILIIIWINLSGAGNYGYQSPDYVTHNARLKDLIDYPWPVHYGENQNFVSYFGYFLPAAIIGKLSNIDIAFRSMYPWTILGITLVLRWLSLLSGWRFSASIVIIFVFFGPVDILNLLILGYHSDVPVHSAIAETLVNSDYLDFRSKYDLGHFIGNYPSNTFQLFWSPHQVIAGWLVISLMTYLFLKKQTNQIVFIYALLCLWSPLIMIALFPFVFLTISSQLLNNKWRDTITLENTLGAAALTILFVSFYLGGSPDAIPTSFILSNFDWPAKGWVLALFYLSAWGAYTITQVPSVTQHDTNRLLWFICLIVTLFLLPLETFGTYSDLLCRGSAPLMFLLLVFILQAMSHYWLQKRYLMLCVLISLVVLGSGSSLLQFRTAFNQYGKKAIIGSIVDNNYANENLGRDDTFFNRHFRR